MSAKRISVSRNQLVALVTLEIALFIAFIVSLSICLDRGAQIAKMTSDFFDLGSTVAVQIQHAERAPIALRKTNCELRRRVVELEKDNARIALGSHVDLDGVWPVVPPYEWIRDSNRF